MLGSSNSMPMCCQTLLLLHAAKGQVATACRKGQVAIALMVALKVQVQVQALMRVMTH